MLSSLAAMMAYSANAMAGTDSGPYIGFGTGSTSVEFSDGQTSIKADDVGVKAIVGYNFGVIPLIDLGIEGAYVNFGEFDEAGSSYDQTSWNGFGIAGLSFGPFGVFAKGGIAAWSREIQTGGNTRKEDSTDPVYGLGARLRLGAFTGRIEYEYYDLKATRKNSMSSASILYHF